MIYPDFLKPGDTIGICAPSAGIGDDLLSWQKSILVLRHEGFRILETPSVRNRNVRSADAKTRGRELNSLFANNKVSAVFCAAGGDFNDECLPYIYFQEMKKYPKWLMGASDPTAVLYPYTTLCDVATLYGLNAISYKNRPLPDFERQNLEILKGERLSEESFPRYLSDLPYAYDTFIYDKPSDMSCSLFTEESENRSADNTAHEFHTSGRCIGGCIDGLKDLIGTPWDGTKQFLQRYQKDGFIWYFDNFNLSAETLYRTLLQMKYAGWFDHTKAVIIGRTIFPSSETGMTYEAAGSLALPSIPVISRADIGHTVPHMTMINGAMLDLTYQTGPDTDYMKLSFHCNQ